MSKTACDIKAAALINFKIKNIFYAKLNTFFILGSPIIISLLKKIKNVYFLLMVIRPQLVVGHA